MRNGPWRDAFSASHEATLMMRWNYAKARSRNEPDAKNNC